jgi:hypothetical protein
MLIFHCILISVSCMPVDRTPMRKRGPRAWENVENGDTLHLRHPEVSRLVTHAASDATMPRYLPAVKAFVGKKIEEGIDMVSYSELDRLLMKYMDKICYQEKMGKSKGALIFYGLLASCPEMKGLFPRTSRALTAWSTIAPGGEGGPMPEEIVWVAVKRYLVAGRIWEAWITAVSLDGYLRTQDWDQLSGYDVYVDNVGVALSFGLAERGCESKTGTNQGVVLGRGWIAEGMAALKVLVDPHAKFFPTYPPKFRTTWQRLWEKEGHPEMRAVHDLRHTAASEDISRGRRDIIGVQKRGRWKAPSSCARYNKTHLLTKRRAEFGEELLREGEEFILDPRKSVVKAILAGPGRHCSAGKALLAAFTKPPRFKDSLENVRPSPASPRIEPLGDPSELPGEVLNTKLKARGRSTWGSRATRERRLEEEALRPPPPPEFSLDTENETCGGSDDEEEGLKVDKDKVCVFVGQREHLQQHQYLNKLRAQKKKGINRQ